MNTTSNKLVAILSIVAVALAAGTASAKDKDKGNSGNGNNSHKSNFSIGIGIGVGSLNNSKKPCYDGHCYDTVYVKKVYVEPCYYPLHCFAWVLPGDTWVTISQREYGNPNLFPSIAAFNRMSLGLPLMVGQQIRLPEIHPGGVLKISFAPAPAPLFLPAAQAVGPIATPALPLGATQGLPTQGLPNASSAIGSQTPIGMVGGTAMGGPTTGNTAPIAGMSAPSFAVGSVIALDGQFGDAAGSARLKLNGFALKADVVEWSAGSVKIHFPEVELTAAIGGELEVLRADGSLAAKTALQLTPAASKVALGN